MSLSPWLRPLVLLSLTCWHFDHARTATAGTVYNVSAGDDFFSPASVTLLTGDQVKWTWTGVHSHNTTSDTALWGSATLGNGSTFTETFNTAGFFPYRCTIHAPMLASVT